MKIYNSHEYLLEKAKRIKPICAYDAEKDFTMWKNEAKDKLMELLGLPFEKCEDLLEIKSRCKTEEYESIVFEFQSEEGYFIPCELIMPLGEKKPRPTVICLQGHSTGKHITMGEMKYPIDERSVKYSNHAIRAVREGLCAVVFDQRYMGTAGQNEAGAPACLKTNMAAMATMLGRTAIGERVWDIQRLIDVLLKYFSDYVQEDRIVCLGNSGGGTATFYAAALEERIYMAVPSCAVCRFADSIMTMFHCSCNHIPNIFKYFDMGDIGCLIAPRKLLMVNGVEDYMFPVEGAEACFEVIQKAYQKLGFQDACMMRKGDAGHQFYPDIVWPIVRREVM